MIVTHCVSSSGARTSYGVSSLETAAAFQLFPAMYIVAQGESPFTHYPTKKVKIFYYLFTITMCINNSFIYRCYLCIFMISRHIFTKGIFAFFDTLPDASKKERLLITVRHNAPGLFKLRCYF